MRKLALIIYTVGIKIYPLLVSLYWQSSGIMFSFWDFVVALEALTMITNIYMATDYQTLYKIRRNLGSSGQHSQLENFEWLCHNLQKLPQTLSYFEQYQEDEVQS